MNLHIVRETGVSKESTYMSMNAAGTSVGVTSLPAIQNVGGWQAFPVVVADIQSGALGGCPAAHFTRSSHHKVFTERKSRTIAV